MFHVTLCGCLAHTLLVGAVSTPADSGGVPGLPVVEVRARAGRDSTLAVLLSGDGGWAAGDRTIAAAFAGAGVPVVGLDVPSYLAVARTPAGASADLQRLLEHYLGSWHKRRVILIGYSHGANIAPFMVSRLPDSLRQRIDLLAMVGLEDHASFDFSLADVVADVRHEGDLPFCRRWRSCADFRCCACGARTTATRSVARSRRRRRVETIRAATGSQGRRAELGTLILSGPAPLPQRRLSRRIA